MTEAVRKFLQDQFGESLIKETDFRGLQAFYVKPEALLEICEALQAERSLDVRFLSDITSVDWLGHEQEMGGRFEVVYIFFSPSHSHRFSLRVMLPEENPEVESLTPLWDGANWMEREVWDMMGIVFTRHPNLTKLLTPDNLEGHPLRRDFPLTWEEPAFTWNKDDPPEVIR